MIHAGCAFGFVVMRGRTGAMDVQVLRVSIEARVRHVGRAADHEVGTDDELRMKVLAEQHPGSGPETTFEEREFLKVAVEVVLLWPVGLAVVLHDDRHAPAIGDPRGDHFGDGCHIARFGAGK